MKIFIPSRIIVIEITKDDKLQKMINVTAVTFLVSL
jgi:hypothetical protein